jgi:hypothetical protein
MASFGPPPAAGSANRDQSGSGTDVYWRPSDLRNARAQKRNDGGL